jgi:hypothetical protein
MAAGGTVIAEMESGYGDVNLPDLMDGSVRQL